MLLSVRPEQMGGAWGEVILPGAACFILMTMATSDISNLRINWDLVAYSRDGQPMLAVEAKKKLNASRQWAIQLRRNILAHGVYPDTRFFLLAMPDMFYLWTDPQAGNKEQEPKYAVDAKSVLMPYIERIGIPPEQMSGSSFELLVSFWLSDLLSADRPPEELEKTQQWLIQSGLYQAIRGGRIEPEAEM